MTEQEWLDSSDLYSMLRFVDPDNRKLRLFAIACVRQVWHLLADIRSRNAVDVAERFADGHATTEELKVAWEKSFVSLTSGDLAFSATLISSDSDDMVWTAYEAASFHGKLQVDLLREVFNPFHHKTRIDANSVNIAKAIYNEKTFNELPILADALEDIGVTDAKLLQHLRSTCHVKGCWALDVIMTQEVT